MGGRGWIGRKGTARDTAKGHLLQEEQKWEIVESLRRRRFEMSKKGLSIDDEIAEARGKARIVLFARQERERK